MALPFWALPAATGVGSALFSSLLPEPEIPDLVGERLNEPRRAQSRLDQTLGRRSDRAQEDLAARDLQHRPRQETRQDDGLLAPPPSASPLDPRRVPDGTHTRSPVRADQPAATYEAQGNALGAMMGAMAGSTGEDGQAVEAVAPETLRALLPETLGDLRRTSISANRSGAMGMQMSEASADYEGADGSGRVQVGIRDMAAVSGMMAMAGAFGVEQSSETDDGYERTYSRDGRLVNEEWNSRSGYGKYAVTVGNRFQVEASGQAGSIDELKDIVGRLDRQVAALQ